MMVDFLEHRVIVMMVDFFGTQGNCDDGYDDG